MKKIIGFLVIFLFLILQLAFLPHISFFGVSPNILFAAILIFSILRQSTSVLFFAFFSGMVLDIFSSQALGIYTLDFVLLVWLVQFVGKNFFKAADFSGQISIIAGACAFYSLINLFLIKIFFWLGLGHNTPFWYDILRIGLLEILLNFIFATIALLIYRKTHGLFARI